MDENAIFKDPSEVQLGQQQQQPLKGNPIIPPAPEELPTAPPPSVFFKVLKVALGITVVLAIVFLIYNFVLPGFFPSKINQVKLVYWGLFEDSSTVTPIISDFEKEHPNIKIEYTKQSLGQYKDRLIVRSDNGNGPDVFRFHNTWTPVLSDYLLPLPETTVSKEDFARDYYPVAGKDLIKNGAIYGVPLQVDTLNLYVNKDLFQAAGLAPPTTWIDFANYSRQLTVKDEDGSIKTAGAAMGTFSNITNASSIIAMLMVQNGVDLNNMSSNIEAASEALTFYTSFAVSPANVWNESLDQSVKAFSSGTLAMYFGYSWDFFTIKSINPNLSFDVYPVPNLSGQSVSIASYWAEGVSSKTKHQKEALLFLKYLSEKETARKLFAQASKTRNFGEPYARIDLADSLKSSAAYPFVANAQFAVSSFFVNGTNDSGLNSQMNNSMKKAVESVLAGESLQSATETLSSEASQALKQYGL